MRYMRYYVVAMYFSGCFSRAVGMRFAFVRLLAVNVCVQNHGTSDRSAYLATVQALKDADGLLQDLQAMFDVAWSRQVPSESS